MFVLDTQGAARGEMFHRAIETLLDLAGEQAYARTMIEAEWSNHRMNGVSKAQFDAFFESWVRSSARRSARIGASTPTAPGATPSHASAA